MCLSDCKRCYDTPYPFIESYFSYKQPAIKKIIHAIKYFHRKDLLEPIATLSATTLQAHVVETTVLVPIPMTRLRKSIRGHNHAETFAKLLSLKTTIPYRTDILTRVTHKKQQVKTKGRSERLANQRNTMKIFGNVTGLSIILIDDVTTTGATLLEARTKLLEAGARTVTAFTIAH